MKSASGIVTIVTGLPRSGTSLVMQMLGAAGLPLLVDAERAADADNPRGYFEYAPVRALRRDASWIVLARGRALKVVAPLLDSLPTGHDYRFVWIHRGLDEVLASQRAMLERRAGLEAAAASDERELRRAFENQLQRARGALERRRPRVPILDLQHSELLESPRREASRLCAFVSDPLDASAAAAVVDPTLHRQRCAPEGRPASPARG